ncbi:MAG: BglG family transcription antiterminator [Sporolactobacillus sp.]
MFLTNREKVIIELLIKTGGRHTTLSIASYLQVSVRTVTRDLKKIKSILQSFDLQLEQGKENCLRIAGSDQSIYKLAQKLSTIKPLDLSTKERNLLLLIELMEQTEPLKTAWLARVLNSSATTLSSYLNELEEWLKDFDISLIRKRGVGIALEGTESSKRIALGNFYLTYFNEELIEAIYKIDNPEVVHEDAILHYFKPDYLKKIDQVIKKYIREMYAELADSDYIGFLLQVCIAYQRYTSGFRIEETDQVDDRSPEKVEVYPIVKQMTNVLSEQLAIDLSEHEKAFLAIILRSSRLQSAEPLYYDRVITGQKVKQLIQHVSSDLRIDLTKDFSLFQGLLAHLEPSVFRIRKNMLLPNPLTNQVKTQFPILFTVVSEELKRVFTDIVFPDEETAYIVFHFGASMEQKRRVTRVRLLVVCPTGIGTSKMLETLLKREFLETITVSISSISDMGRIQLQNFDLILTTVHLPKPAIPCILVNPILSKENIRDIRSAINDFRKRQTLPTPFSREKTIKKKEMDRPLETLMHKTETLISSIREILSSFQVYSIQQAETVEDVLREVMNNLKKKGMVDDPDQVVAKLLAREKVAGLAIPGTPMALYHCLYPAVNPIIFQIAHTRKQFKLRGMDGTDQMSNCIIILIAPEPIDLLNQEIVSTVSASLVEDSESTLIFSSANEKLIRGKLESVFYQLLINKFSKD